MKITIPLISLCVVLSGSVSAQEAKHASLVSEVLATYTPHAEKNGYKEAMAGLAKTFLGSLTDDLREDAALPFDSDEKKKWTNTPPRGPQGGVRLGDCDKEQLKAACNFLRCVLSEQGYEKMRNIMLADDLLLRDGKARAGFGAENFWLGIYGEPSTEKPWAIQLDGHHVGINLNFNGDEMGMSPSFIGTQPRAIKLADKKIEVLEGESGVAYKLINTLSDEQKRVAIVSKRRGGMAAGAGRDGVVPEMVGFPCKEFDAEQRKLLVELMNEWVADMPAPFAKKRMAELEKEIDAMKFAWSGPTTLESDISYRLQGPTLIIEYACQDLGGDPLDHLHTMYRNPTDEYGEGE